MNITIFGSGYVGLVTGACLADAGHKVFCVDIDKEKIENLNQSVIPIYEPGLEDLIKKNLNLNIFFTTNAEKAIADAELIFIAVGTPPGEDGSADLKYVLSVAETIGLNMNDDKIVINKSTVPVGTVDLVQDTIQNKLTALNKNFLVQVCSNPEYLKEGSAIEDFMNSERIVIGTNSSFVKNKMSECYARYSKDGTKLIFMSPKSAELTKYAANAMLATKISFMNELSQISENLGADISDIRIGIGTDPRIGFEFMNPGCGYGGSCFPKDVRALQKTATDSGSSTLILDAIEGVNSIQKKVLFKKIKNYFKDDLKNKNIAIWGLSFKPNTDDMREAPSIYLINDLIKKGCNVFAYDPKASIEAKKIFGMDNISFKSSKDEVLNGADMLVICTEWEEFQNINDMKYFKHNNIKVIIDGRNIYDPKEFEELDIDYYGIGTGKSIIKK